MRLQQVGLQLVRALQVRVGQQRAVDLAQHLVGVHVEAALRVERVELRRCARTVSTEGSCAAARRAAAASARPTDRAGAAKSDRRWRPSQQVAGGAVQAGGVDDAQLGHRSRQRGSASGQRVWKAQPVGRVRAGPARRLPAGGRGARGADRGWAPRPAAPACTDGAARRTARRRAPSRRRGPGTSRPRCRTGIRRWTGRAR